MRGAAASASGRFYHAFYRWHALTTCRHAPSPVPAPANVLPARRPLTTSVARREQDETAAPSSAHAAVSRSPQVRRHWVTPRSDARRGSKPRDQQQDSPEHDEQAELQRLPRFIRNAPVLSPADKPFDTFGEWGHAVRYRSDSSMLLQLAVRTDELAVLQEEFDPQLGALPRQYSGARIEVADAITTPDGVSLTSVTLSGSFSELRRTYSFLARHRARGWFFKAISTDESPSNALPSWSRVMREVDGKFRKLEIVLPTTSLARLQRILPPDLFAAQQRVTLTYAPVQRADIADGIDMHSLFISGEYPRVWRAQDAIFARRAAAEGSDNSAPAPGHSMTLQMPHASDRQGGNQPMALVVGKGGERLKRLKREFDVDLTVLRRQGRIRLDGSSQSGVEQVKSQIDQVVARYFENEDLPAAPVKVVARSSPTSSTGESPEAQPLAPGKQDVASPPHKDRGTQASAHEDSTTAGENFHRSQPPSYASEKDMKLALSSLTHPVVLVTAETAERTPTRRLDDLLPIFRGATVSSFNSVTLKPVPIVSFNVRTPSRTWDAMKSSYGFMRAHILNASPAGAALAHEFTLPYERPDEPFQRVRRLGAKIETGHARKSSPPFIALDGAVLCTMRAKVDLEKSVQVGDHMIVVAEVWSVAWQAQENDDHEALSYSHRQYRTMGQPVEAAAIPEVGSRDASTSDVSAMAVQQDVGATDHLEHRLGLPLDEDPAAAQDVDAMRTPEETEIHYFQAVADDDYVIDAHGGQAVSSRSPAEALASTEDEYDFGFALADEEQAPRAQTLVDDSDAARKHDRAATSSDAPAAKEGSDAQKRHGHGSATP